MGLGQDLQQEKQAKVNRINEIDAQLKSGLTPDEDAKLREEREKLVEEIKDINKKLQEDVEAQKKMAATGKAFNNGKAAYTQGQYQEALKFFNKALALDSTFSRAYYMKGLTLKKLRKYNDAIEAYQAAIRHNPTYDDAYFALGKIYSAIGKVDDAIATYQKAFENNPTSYKAYYEMGVLYLNKKRNYSKAAEAFRQATQIKPDYGKAFYSLGVSMTELGKYYDAIMALESAVALREKWAAPYFRLAVIYNKKGQPVKAKKAAANALKYKRNYAPAAYEAGKASKALGQFTEAINYFKIAAKDRNWRRAAEYEIDLIQNRDKYGGGNF
jgi:tetratricopeptide (TPR) repeat protein